MRKYHLAKLAIAVKAVLMLGLGGTGVVYAQEAANASASDEDRVATQTKSLKEKQKEIEIVEVEGYGASLQKNLNIKRFADNVLDAISAEDIGKFPDQNVADALARISGVQVESNFGEAESVSVRGTAPELNRTLLNGQNVASSDWYALSVGKREFNYTLIPSVMVKQLEVHKSPTSDIDEGSIGGTVMMKTRRPLEMDKHSGAFSFRQQYSDLAESWDPQIEGLYSFKSDDETWGALITLASQENNLRRDALNTYSWAQGTIAGRSDVWYPNLVGADHFEQKRERNSGILTLQWTPVDELNLVFNSLYSKMNADNVSQAFYGMTGQSIALGAEPQNVVFDNVNGDTVLAMVVPEIEGNGGFSEDAEVQFDTRNRKAFFKTEHYDLKAEYSSDTYQIDGQIGYTEAEGGNRLEFATAFFADTALYIDNTQGIPQMELLDINVDDTDQFRLGLLSLYDRPQHDDELYGQLDFTYLFDHDILRQIKVGVKYRDHIKSQRANLYGSKLVADGYDISYFDELISEGETTLADYDAGPAPDNFMQGNRLPGSVTDFHFVDFAALEDDIRTNRDRFNTIPLLTAEFDITEEITAGYVRADFEYDKLRGNAGVRLVETALDSASWTYYGPYLNPAEKQWVVHSRTYSDVLPSVNLAYNVSEDVVMRFSAAKVMSRPGYGNMSAYRGLNDSTLTGVGGNPDLEPYRATQYDLSWEWYFEGGGFNTAIFYKNIESYLTTSEVVESHYNKESGLNEDYLVSVKSNGRGGKNAGFELNYQQKLFYGFGVNANYTHISSSTETGDFIPGNSEDTTNFTLYYEEGPISTRLSYNYRSEYYLFNSRGNDVFVDGSERLDATFSYNFSNHISLVLQAINLTDEHQSRYAGEKYRHLATFENGRRFRIGLRVKL